MEENHPEYSHKYLSKVGLAIDRRLPNYFFSFWDIETKKLDAEAIYKMYYFKHLFHLYLINNLSSWDNLESVDIFEDSIIKKIIKVQEELKNYKGNNLRHTLMNIIEHSLCINTSHYEINKLLDSFLKAFFDMDENYIDIVDIKYYDINYFIEPKNIEEIKNRSVRKQFVYEYLMQKEVKKFPKYLNQLKIRSSFWLPGYNQKLMFEDGQKFMDGYIRLKTVDFVKLAESYVS